MDTVVVAMEISQLVFVHAVTAVHRCATSCPVKRMEQEEASREEAGAKGEQLHLWKWLMVGK